MTVLLIARDKPLPNDDTGVSVRMPAQLALWTKRERRAGGVAFFRLSLPIADDGSTTAVALAAGVPGIDAAGDDPLITGLVLGVLEDTTFHPEGALAVSPAAVLALFRAQFP